MPPSTSQDEKLSWPVKLTIILCSLFAVASLIGMGFLAWHDYTSISEWDSRGTSGDFWGGHLSSAGALTSAFLLFIALLLQQHELRLQRHSLRATLEENEQARAVFEKQEQHLARQTEIAEKNATLNELFKSIDVYLKIRPTAGKDYQPLQQHIESLLEQIDDATAARLVKTFALPSPKFNLLFDELFGAGLGDDE